MNCQEKLNNSVEISLEQKECWVGTRHFFVKYYGYKDNTPSDWLNLIEQGKCLKDDIIIHGYSDAKK